MNVTNESPAQRPIPALYYLHPMTGAPIFGFSHRATNVWLPHVLVGLVILGTTAMTETKAPVRATR